MTRVATSYRRIAVALSIIMMLGVALPVVHYLCMMEGLGAVASMACCCDGHATHHSPDHRDAAPDGPEHSGHCCVVQADRMDDTYAATSTATSMPVFAASFDGDPIGTLSGATERSSLQFQRPPPRTVLPLFLLNATILR